MNIPEIFAALAMLEKERGIPQTFMMDKIIQAVTTAYKRDHKDVENVIVDVDEEHQRLKMYVQKNVVAEEDYVDPFNEIPVEEAKTISARYEIGDVVNIPVDNTEFGRIAAGNGKQVSFPNLYINLGGEVTAIPANYFLGGETMTYTVSISDTTVATASIEGRKLTVKGLKSGTTKASITSSGNETHTFNITVRKVANGNGWL